MSETRASRVFVYKTGEFMAALLVIMAVGWTLAGLVEIFNTSGLPITVGGSSKTAAEEPSLATVASGLVLLTVSGAFFWRFKKDSHASGTVALYPDKIQRPFTMGEAPSDFLHFGDIIDARCDRDFHDHGPIVILKTEFRSAAYKSVYFEAGGRFEEFCDCL